MDAPERPGSNRRGCRSSKSARNFEWPRVNIEEIPSNLHWPFEKSPTKFRRCSLGPKSGHGRYFFALIFKFRGRKCFWYEAKTAGRHGRRGHDNFRNVWNERNFIAAITFASWGTTVSISWINKRTCSCFIVLWWSESSCPCSKNLDSRPQRSILDARSLWQYFGFDHKIYHMPIGRWACRQNFNLFEKFWMDQWSDVTPKEPCFGKCQASQTSFRLIHRNKTRSGRLSFRLFCTIRITCQGCQPAYGLFVQGQK